MKSFSEYINRGEERNLETVSEAAGGWYDATSNVRGQEIESYSALIADRSKCSKLFDEVAKGLSDIIKKNFSVNTKFFTQVENIDGETRIYFYTKPIYADGVLKLFTAAYTFEYYLYIKENDFDNKVGAIRRYSWSPLYFHQTESAIGKNMFEGDDLAFDFETGKFLFREK